jgi:hypothetical protein
MSVSLCLCLSSCFVMWVWQKEMWRSAATSDIRSHRLDQLSLSLSVCVLRIATTSITRNGTWILRFFLSFESPSSRRRCVPPGTARSARSPSLSAGCCLAPAAACKKSKPKRESTGIRQKNWEEIIICHAWKYYMWLITGDLRIALL